MADLLGLSRAVIDEGKGADQVGPINRINHQLSELRPDVAVVEAFSHSIVFRTDDGLVAFDTSNRRAAPKSLLKSGGGRRIASIRLSTRTAMWITWVAAARLCRTAAPASTSFAYAAMTTCRSASTVTT